MKSFLRWTLVVVAFMPLVFSTAVLFPYVSAKALFLRAVLFVVAAVFTGLFLSDSNFKKETMERGAALWKEPLVKMMAASWGVLALSTLFAFDRYTAFFGTIDRAEGFVGLSIFYLFFFFALLVFKKKDWHAFFYTSLGTGWILFLVQLSESFRGISRGGSLVDNPIPLAAYFLYVLFAALVLFKQARIERAVGRSVVAATSIGMSIIALLLTESRGAMAGAVIGGIVAVVAFAYFRRSSGGTSRSTKIAAVVLIVMVAFGGLFVATRKSEFWQHVPGLNRAALFTLNDTTTQSRLLNAKISLAAANPKNENMKEALVGWGWDNYIYAWQKNYNPALYGLDTGVFDRAHDKLLDVLVMTGLLGLLAYLAVWACFIRLSFFAGKRDAFIGAVLAFWAVAYFLQNLTAFDTIVTYLCFFAVFAYVVTLRTETEEVKKIYDRKK